MKETNFYVRVSRVASLPLTIIGYYDDEKIDLPCISQKLYLLCFHLNFGDIDGNHNHDKKCLVRTPPISNIGIRYTIPLFHFLSKMEWECLASKTSSHQLNNRWYLFFFSCDTKFDVRSGEE